MNSIPPLPYEELHGQRMQCIQMGKEFRENVERQVIDDAWLEKGGDPSQLLGQVENPEHIPIDPQRARAIRMDDREAKAEFEREQLKGQELAAQRKRSEAMGEAQNDRIQNLEAELAEMRALLAGQAAADPAVRATATEPPKAEKTLPNVPEGAPTMDWPKPSIIEFAKQRGLALPEKPHFATKMVLLEAVLEQLTAGAPA